MPCDRGWYDVLSERNTDGTQALDQQRAHEALGEIDIWYPPAVPDEARIRVTEEVLDRHHDEVITGHHMCRYMRTEAQSILRGLVASGELFKVDGKWKYRGGQSAPDSTA